MAQNAPTSIDVQDIQFKLHGKFALFPESKELKSLVSLLAVSSAKGLLFAGNPSAKELKVIKLKDAVDSKTNGQDLHVRVVSLPGDPKAMACSCDGSMLAVNYILNNTGFLQIYQVDSFLTPNINTLYNVPVSPESYVFALQLLWNPVIANNIALILNDGSVTMFSLNPGGQYDKVTLGKEHQVKSGCWSPKGKQIVLGFADGKLQQFKPNLQPARAIPCPPGIHPGPFDCIAVHWLSTFQFAVVFLQRGNDMCPALFIVNAPKAGNPSYINYYDICYSAPGPRTQQLAFNHISQWNLLLVSSANGVEVGILGTKEPGENPTWIQYTLLDEARIEMPLTESKDETFPMGFAFDTASSHQVKIGEHSLPVMPMIHVLSTDGHLVSFNFLNLSPNVVDVCSPPPPLNDASGQFRPLIETLRVAGAQSGHKPQGSETVVGGGSASAQGGAGYGDMTFTLGPNMVTSTPAIKDKPVPMFGALATGAPKPGSSGIGFGGPAASTPQQSAITTTTAAKPSTGFGFGAGGAVLSAQSAAAAPAGFGTQPMATTFGGFAGGQSFGGAKPSEKQPPPISASAPSSNVQKNVEVNKPLYTVPPTFKPPPVVQPTKTASVPKINMNTGEIDDVVKQMMAIQIEAFETEMKQIQMQARKLIENIGTPDEIKSYSKHLNDLQEIIEQAGDHEFEQDVQSLRHSMNESYAMLAECRTKLDLHNNPNLTRLSTVSTSDPTSRRQLAKLQAYAATNQTQLGQVNHLIDAQWSQYQDIVRRNTKNQMHIPCLDGVYQRMSKLKDLLARQRTKMNHIKSKLKQKGMNYKPSNEADVTSVAVGALTKNQSTMESLADSILSMSLSQVVSQTHAKLSDGKLNAIRNFTKQQQQITIIKPKRPDRIGLKSEVILETKLETERKQKELARQKQQQQLLQQQSQKQQQPQQMPSQKPIQQYPMQAQQMPPKPSQQLPPMNLQQMQQQQQQTFLAKPTASKPPLLSSANQPAAFITPSPVTSSALSFGSQSSFVKTSTASTKHDDSSRPLAASTPFPAFGATSSGLSFGQPKPNTASQNLESKENVPATTPISFSAKVIGGNDVKSFANLGNKPNTSGPLTSASDTTSSNQGFAAFSSNKPTPLSENTTKDAKKPDEAGKAFNFGGISTTLTSSANPTSSAVSATSTPPAFAGFGALAKPAATLASAPVVSSSSSGGVFSSSMFGSGLPSTTSATPFGTLSATSSGSFAPSSTFTFNSTASSTSATMTSSVATKTAETASAPATTASAKPLETKITPSESQVSSSGSTPASFSFSGIGLGNVSSNASTFTTQNSAPPNVTITSSGIPEPKPGAAAPTATKPSTSSVPATTAPADSLFGSLNICKPDTKEAGDSSKTPANIFSGFGAATSTTPSASPFAFATSSGAGDGAKSFLDSTSATSAAASPTTTGFSFGSATSTTANVLGKPTTTSDTAVASTTTVATTTTTAVPASASGTTTPSSFSFGTTTTSGPATGSMFGSLSLSSTTTAASATVTTTTTSTPAPGNAFSGAGAAASSIFSQTAATSTVATTSTTSIFGGTAAAASSGPSLFGSTAPPTAAAADTPSTASIFGGSAATPEQPAGGNIFGGIPKPDQSVFGSSTNATSPPATGLFAAAAAATKPPPATAVGGGGSIFGGAAMNTGFGAPAGGSIFGGGAAAPATAPFGSTASANTGGSIFGVGAAAAKPAEGGNIFGSPTQQSASSGGSIFGKSSFGQTAAPPQSAGSIFGGAAAPSPSTGGFGAPTGGSIFGGAAGAAPNPASGGSIFGGAAAATAPAFGASPASTGFGSFSQASNVPAFGSPSGGFGAAPGAGFGSPQQQSAFAKPIFGGPPTFGSPPAFGAQPTFGGAATFGSPKAGFGSFAATSPAGGGGFGAPAPAPAQGPKGNIFETMGATDSGLSFGNLAQSTQPPPQQKPSFGGSSFMSYRS